jgi:hypothetical protein
MRLNCTVTPILLFLAAIGAGGLSAAPLGTAFSYQGKLAEGGVPAHGLYEMRFAVYDAPANGNAVGNVVTNTITVNNGLFTASLDFGLGVFTGNARWVEVGVRTNGAATVFTALLPRQPLTPSPYAFFSLQSDTARTAGSAAAVAGNGVAGTNLQPNAVTSDKLADGTIVLADLSPALATSTFWRVDGNSGTTPGTHFLGTTDNRALELRVNNRAFLLAAPGTNSPNLVGGSAANDILPDADGATIAGGGQAGEGNLVGGAFNFIGGGRFNTIYAQAWDSAIVGGTKNEIYTNVWAASIGGGEANFIDSYSDSAVVGGGLNNFIAFNAPYAGILAGQNNLVGEDAGFAVIGGGAGNWVQTNAAYATIPGGAQAAARNYGQMAYASGMFEDWGDAQASLYLLRATTTNAVQRELFLDGLGQRLRVPVGGGWMCQIMIVARNQNGGLAMYRAEAGVKNVNGTVSLVGPGTVTQGASEIAGLPVPSVVADNVNKALLIRATGVSGQRIRWVARVETVELIF